MHPLSVFAFCWALSGLLDLAPLGSWSDTPVHMLYAAASLVVLVRPAWLAAFVVMNVLRLAAFWLDTPDTANHLVLYAVVAATILAALPLAARGAGGLRRVSPEAWRAQFAPVARVELLVLYFFAVLHKLNWDYLDPAVSCGVQIPFVLLPEAATGWLSARPLLLHAMIWGSLLLEASIPVLIALRATRHVGLALGVLFHVVLGIRFYAFSTGLLALYSLFLPASVFAGAGLALARWRRAPGIGRLASPWSARLLGLGLVAGFGLIGGNLLEVDSPLSLPRGAFPVLAGVWAAVALLGVGLVLLAREARPHWREPAPGRVAAAPWLLALAALLLLNGLSPYLGLRTVPTFSMFSNLRTEGGITNHLFMPATALRVASYQDDLVTMLQAEEPELRRFSKRPRRTFYDLRRRVQGLAAKGRTDIRLAYRRGARRVDTAEAERDPELMAPISWWQRKWLRFRPVPVSVSRECSW